MACETWFHKYFINQQNGKEWKKYKNADLCVVFANKNIKKLLSGKWVLIDYGEKFYTTNTFILLNYMLVLS